MPRSRTRRRIEEGKKTRKRERDGGRISAVPRSRRRLTSSSSSTSTSYCFSSSSPFPPSQDASLLVSSHLCTSFVSAASPRFFTRLFARAFRHLTPVVSRHRRGRPPGQPLRTSCGDIGGMRERRLWIHLYPPASPSRSPFLARPFLPGI